MLLENKDKLIVEANFESNVENLDQQEIEKYEKQSKEIAEFINNKFDIVLNIFEKAENYLIFDIEFFVFWYGLLKKRYTLFIPLEQLARYYNFKLPPIFFLDKNLFDERKTIETETVKVEKNVNDSDKYLKDSIIIGDSKIEIYSNTKIDLKKELENDLKNRNKSIEVKKIYDEAENLMNQCKSYSEYFRKLNDIYIRLYEICDDYLDFELNRGYISYGLPNRVEEWKKDIPKVTAFTFQTTEPMTLEDAKMYMREEELLKIYEVEKYIVRPLIFNDNYEINQREKYIEEFLNIMSSNNELYEFTSDSIKKQVDSFLKKQNVLELLNI